MLKNGIIISALVALSACGDPLSGVPRLSDVDLVETGPAAAAVPSDAEIAREGFFGTDARATHIPIDGVLTPVAKPTKPGGLLGMLRRAVPSPRPAVRAAAQSPVPIAGTQSDDVIDPVGPADAQAALASAPDASATPRKGGLFGGLLQGSNKPASSQTGVDATDVTYGTVLPYGVVARVCDARRKPLGRKVENASASGYKLYDSAPGTTGARTYYITGFDDDCPRQLTAAHVLLGAPSFYEQLHYGPARAHLTFGETDRAYEKVKARVCGARKGKPCGSKMRSLERNTFFVNTYERLDDNTRWSELLVHDGQVVAASLKTN